MKRRGITIKKLTDVASAWSVFLILAMLTISLFISYSLYVYVIEPEMIHSDVIVSDDYTMLETLISIDADKLYERDYQEYLFNEAARYHYLLNIEHNGDTVLSNMSENVKYTLLGTEKNYEILKTHPVVYQRLGTTVIQLLTTDSANKEYICHAINYTQFKILGFTSNSFYVFITIMSFSLAVFLFTAGALISLYNSRKFDKKISHPLNMLSSAASSVMSGDYSNEIEYEGLIEFEKVCNVFNEMQKKLIQNDIENERQHRARNELFAGISHDIKTPLTAIKGYVKGLLDGVATTEEKQRHYLEVTLEKAQSIESLVEIIILLAKLELNNIPLEKEIINLNNYIGEYVESMKETDELSCVLEFLPQGNLFVDIDTMQINRVLSNIIVNSINYANVDNLEVCIYTKREDNSAVIYIKDNGKGVSDDKINSIFRTFYRADEARSNTVKGHGMGLAIAKSIIERHQGTITAYNDNGLVVKITLPIKEN